MIRWMVFIFFINVLNCSERASSYPYLSGDLWRFFADWRLTCEEGFDPKGVRLGDTIFVEYDLLKRFGRKYLPKIRNRFILITPNCESGTDNPQPGRFAHLLESSKIAAWFVQNIDREATERVIPLPIGLANKVWPCGQISALDPMVKQAHRERSCLLYANFVVQTNLSIRLPCMQKMQSLPFSMVAQNRSFEEYLKDLSHTVFVASPPGNGQDCHRTWEALVMGCYPIVLSSTLNPLYEDLPVVVVSSWDEITEEFLRKKEEEFLIHSWNEEKLYAPYWYRKVFSIQQNLRKNPTFVERIYSWF